MERRLPAGRYAAFQAAGRLEAGVAAGRDAGAPHRVKQVLWLLATITLLSCNRTAPAPAAPHHASVAQALTAKPHRLAVVFWPQATGCASCDQMVSAVIAEWQTTPDAELAVVSVLPDRVLSTDPWLPGAIVRLNPEDYARHAGKAPRPRVEIWNAHGDLLLSRSVPNYGSQAELLNEEMFAARSFTAPVAVAAGRRP